MFLEGLLDKVQGRHTDIRLPNSIIYYGSEKNGKRNRRCQSPCTPRMIVIVARRPLV
jgi:hypothetical protein